MCHGVSVPPQSKMTASTTVTVELIAAIRRGGLGDRHVLAVAGTTVAHLDHTVGEAPADDDDRRHAEQLGVLELHPGRDSAAVVEEHGQPGRHQVARERLAPRSNTASSLPVATTCTSAGAIARGQDRPSSSWVDSAIAATARETPMP